MASTDPFMPDYNEDGTQNTVRSLKHRIDITRSKIDALLGGRFEVCVSRLLVSEGGYSEHKNDRGGRTNHGISEWMFNKARRDGIVPLSVREPRDLSVRTAKVIYYQYYWTANGCENMPPGKDYFLFDVFVNHAWGDAMYIRNAAEIKTMFKRRVGVYKTIVKNNPSQAVFLDGWLARAKRVFDEARADAS